MTGFARFGIKHLSPSSLNLWLAQPAMWTLKYVHGYKDEAGPAMARGTAVEAGLQALLVGSSVDGAVTAAHVNYDLNQPEPGDERDAERAVIEPMVRQLPALIGGWPPPVSYQRKVQAEYTGASTLPIIGYLDFEFEDCIVDLKTTKALPGKARIEHVRQVGLYAHATGKPVKLLYLTPKKASVISVSPEDAEAGWRQLRAAARALERTLTASPTADALSEFFVPDFDSYHWDEKSVSKAKEVYNVHA